MFAVNNILSKDFSKNIAEIVSKQLNLQAVADTFLNSFIDSLTQKNTASVVSKTPSASKDYIKNKELQEGVLTPKSKTAATIDNLSEEKNISSSQSLNIKELLNLAFFGNQQGKKNIGEDKSLLKLVESILNEIKNSNKTASNSDNKKTEEKEFKLTDKSSLFDVFKEDFKKFKRDAQIIKNTYNVAKTVTKGVFDKFKNKESEQDTKSNEQQIVQPQESNGIDIQTNNEQKSSQQTTKDNNLLSKQLTISIANINKTAIETFKKSFPLLTENLKDQLGDFKTKQTPLFDKIKEEYEQFKKDFEFLKNIGKEFTQTITKPSTGKLTSKENTTTPEIESKEDLNKPNLTSQQPNTNPATLDDEDVRFKENNSLLLEIRGLLETTLEHNKEVSLLEQEDTEPWPVDINSFAPQALGVLLDIFPESAQKALFATNDNVEEISNKIDKVISAIENISINSGGGDSDSLLDDALTYFGNRRGRSKGKSKGTGTKKTSSNKTSKSKTKNKPTTKSKPAEVIPSKETTKAEKETAEVIPSKETTKAEKETAEVIPSKETPKAEKETAEVIPSKKEASVKAEKEVGDAVSKKSTSAVGKETAEVVGKKATESVGKQAAEIIGKKAATSAGKGVAKTGTKAVEKAGTKAVEKAVGKAGTKAVEKAVGKAGLGAVVKKIPLLGAVAGGVFAAQRALEGDYIGAAGELASGVASTVPGAGTAVSTGIDAALLAKDVAGYNEGGVVQHLAEGGETYDPFAINPKPENNSDTVPAMLTPGEFVVNKEDAQKNLPQLKAINEGKELPKETLTSTNSVTIKGFESMALQDLKSILSSKDSNPKEDSKQQTDSKFKTALKTAFSFTPLGMLSSNLSKVFEKPQTESKTETENVSIKSDPEYQKLEKLFGPGKAQEILENRKNFKDKKEQLKQAGLTKGTFEQGKLTSTTDEESKKDFITSDKDYKGLEKLFGPGKAREILQQRKALESKKQQLTDVGLTKGTFEQGKLVSAEDIQQQTISPIKSEIDNSNQAGWKKPSITEVDNKGVQWKSSPSETRVVSKETGQGTSKASELKFDYKLLESIAQNTKNTNVGMESLANAFNAFVSSFDKFGSRVGEKINAEPVVIQGAQNNSSPVAQVRASEIARAGNKSITNMRLQVETSRPLPS